MDLKTAQGMVNIDELELQEECVKLPTQYLRTSFQAAELRNTLATQEIEFKEMEAKLSKKVRDTPNQYGIEKATRDAVDEVVAAMPQLSIARSSIQETRFALDKLSSVMAALEMKKRSLGNLVSLYSMGYHGSVKGKSREEREQIDEAAQREVAKRTRRPQAPRQEDEDEG